MKVRYLGKLYNTEKMDTILEERREYGYFNDLISFIADDGEKIYCATSKFTNFDHYAYTESCDYYEREFHCKELKSGVVKIEHNIGIE